MGLSGVLGLTVKTRTNQTLRLLALLQSKDPGIADSQNEVGLGALGPPLPRRVGQDPEGGGSV